MSRGLVCDRYGRTKRVHPLLRPPKYLVRVLAAGFEPALTALEEQRLRPLGHASIQKSSGIDEIRTRVVLIDNQVPMPLGHDPNGDDEA